LQAFTAQVSRTLVQEQVMASLAAFFGVLALGLAAIGLYGLIAYRVLRRTGEIGIRMALGARRRDVLWLVLQDALRLVAGGVLFGLPAAWAASRLVSSMLFGVTATDPVTVSGALALLSTAALFAAFIPAVRAARVEPMTALRNE
jgi:ABC-type antimicrobial peptide transport system permease subunit